MLTAIPPAESRLVSKKEEGKRRAPKQARAKATVEVMLDAAAKLMKEEGYAALTTTRIAKRAGTSVGSVYQYFPNSESIAIALVEDRSLRLADAAREELRELMNAPLEELMPRSVETLIDLYTENKSVLIDLVDADPKLRSVAQSLAAELLNFSTYQGYLTRHLEELGVEDIELAVRITGLVGVSVARAFVAAPEAPVPKEVFAREVGKMLTRYLSADDSTAAGAPPASS
jgi:AcrR family transcriptional regulator